MNRFLGFFRHREFDVGLVGQFVTTILIIGLIVVLLAMAKALHGFLPSGGGLW